MIDFQPQRSRFRRQIRFAPFGKTGQENLEKSCVLVVGCGALGGAAANLLARAGVGRLILVDPDVVQPDNLHRQILFSEADAEHAVPKIVASRNALRQANGALRVDCHRQRFEPGNADSFFERDAIDLILDGTDNFATRLAMNTAAIRYGKPLVSGGVLGTSGQVFTVLPGETPCLACILGVSGRSSGKVADRGSDRVPGRAADASLTADANGVEANSIETNSIETNSIETNGIEETGILSPIVHVIASFQTMEALKILGGKRETVNRSLVHFDLWNNRIREMSLDGARNPDCPACRETPANETGSLPT